MTYLNSFADFVVGTPLRQFTQPWPGLVVVALATSIALLLVIRWVSSPAAIRRSKERLIARVLELVLFRHDARVSFTAGGRILAANLAYLRTLLGPVAVSAVPCILILSQLSCWYAWRPLKAGEAALIEVKLREGFPVLEQSVSLSVPTCARVETAGVRVLAPPEVAWRLRAEQDGSDWIDIVVGDQAPVRKQLVVGEALQKVSARRSSRGIWESLLYPAEPPIDKASSIVAVDVRYPPRLLYLGNAEVDWVLAFVILTMVFGLLLKRPLRVQL
jgi:hypothetical protein